MAFKTKNPLWKKKGKIEREFQRLEAEADKCLREGGC